MDYTRFFGSMGIATIFVTVFYMILLKVVHPWISNWRMFQTREGWAEEAKTVLYYGWATSYGVLGILTLMIWLESRGQLLLWDFIISGLIWFALSSAPMLAIAAYKEQQAELLNDSHLRVHRGLQGLYYGLALIFAVYCVFIMHWVFYILCPGGCG